MKSPDLLSNFAVGCVYFMAVVVLSGIFARLAGKVQSKRGKGPAAVGAVFFVVCTWLFALALPVMTALLFLALWKSFTVVRLLQALILLAGFTGFLKVFSKMHSALHKMILSGASGKNDSNEDCPNGPVHHDMMPLHQ